MTSQKKLLKKLFAMLMAVALMIPSATLNAFAVVPGEVGSIKNTPTTLGDDAFASNVDKSAKVTDEEGVFEIELKVTGDSRTEEGDKVDVVFVLDTSGSMSKENMIKANNAIKTFMDTLVQGDGASENIRFGLVKFAGSVGDTIPLTKNKSDIVLSDAKGDGATFTQMGLRSGANLFNSAESRKIIVLLTDGVPTKSYKVQAVGGIVADSSQINLYGSSSSGKYEPWRAERFTSTIIGSGSSYELSSTEKHKLWLNQAERDAHVEKGYWKGWTWVNQNHTQKLTVVDNGFATISEARKIKASNIEIFGIGLDVTGSGNGISKQNAKNVIKDIASSGDKFFDVTNLNNLSTILGNIAKTITVDLIDGGRLVDPMSEHVELIGNQNDITITLEHTDHKPTINWDANEKQINLSNIKLGAGQSFTLKYKVRLNEAEYAKGLKPLNGTTVLYQNATGNEKIEINVPQGQVFRAGAKFVKTFAEKTPIGAQEATFNLYKQLGDEQKPDTDTKMNSTPYTANTENGGKVETGNILPAGKYYFVEISAPAGYRFAQFDTFTVVKNSNEIHDLGKINNTIQTFAMEFEKTVISINDNTANTTTYAKVGDKVTYKFTVKNTGESTLTNVVVNDPMLGESISLDKTTLAPSETATGTATYMITQADIDDRGYETNGKAKIINTATASATPPVGDSITATDSATITASDDLKPSILVSKNSDKKIGWAVGEEITYSVTVQNPSKFTLNNVTLKDIMHGNDDNRATITQDIWKNSDNKTLNPGETVENITYKYTVTQADVDAGKIHNEIIAQGKVKDLTSSDGGNTTVGHNAELTVTTVGQPSISLEKTTVDTTYTTVGNEINYSYVVTNSGPITLKNISLTDPLRGLGNLTLYTDEACTNQITTSYELAPSGKLYAKASYTVDQADINARTVDEIATVSGTPTVGEPVNATDNAPSTYVSTANDEGITLTKEIVEYPSESEEYVVIANPTYNRVNEEVAYRFVITNTGKFTLNNIRLEDALLNENVNFSKTSLEPNESLTVYGIYTLTEDDKYKHEVVNTATAYGTPAGKDEAISAVDTATIKNIAIPDFTFTKEADRDTFSAIGEIITYTFTVKNTGTETLCISEIEDALIKSQGGTVNFKSGELAPGEEITGTATYTVTEADYAYGEVYNKANITALTKEKIRIEKDADATVTGDFGALTILKVEQGTATPLAGAEFELYPARLKGEPEPGTTWEEYAKDHDNWELDPDASAIGPVATGSDGKVTFTGLTLPVYYYKETKAPDGYTLNSAMVRVELEIADMAASEPLAAPLDAPPATLPAEPEPTEPQVPEQPSVPEPTELEAPVEPEQPTEPEPVTPEPTEPEQAVTPESAEPESAGTQVVSTSVLAEEVQGETAGDDELGTNGQEENTDNSSNDENNNQGAGEQGQEGNNNTDIDEGNNTGDTEDNDGTGAGENGNKTSDSEGESGETEGGGTSTDNGGTTSLPPITESEQPTPFLHQTAPLVSEFEPSEFEFKVYSKTVTVENTKIPVDPGPGPGPNPDDGGDDGGDGGGPTPPSPVRPDPITITPDPVPLAEPEEVIEAEEIPLVEMDEIEIEDEVIPLAAVPKTGIGHIDYSTILSTNYVVTVDGILEDKRKRK